jgi:hypothetical protein
MTEDIYRVQDEVLRMVYDHEWGGYEKGVQAERERIINLIKEVVSEHQARDIQNVPSRLLIQLIEKGTK